MNYKHIYDKIIQNRFTNPICDDTYTETHHIIPRSLGGIDSENNLIKLTAKEHYILIVIAEGVLTN
jgi:5-methylcytosine-specific restriction endonuclease McrA